MTSSSGSILGKGLVPQREIVLVAAICDKYSLVIRVWQCCHKQQVKVETHRLHRDQLDRRRLRALVLQGRPGLLSAGC